MSITSNRLLIWSVAVVVAYWLLGIAVPGEWMSGGASLLLLIFAGVTLLRYAPETWRIVVQGRRGEGQDGSHLAAYGVTLAAGGAVYIGLFGLLWVALGQPDNWLSTSASGFGRAVTAAGYGLLFFSPDVTKQGFRLPLRLWAIALLLASLLAAFFFGVQIGQNDTKEASRDSSLVSLNECPDETPVAGNQGRNGWVYHMPGGPYYSQTVAEECFETEGAARLAGYRPAGR